MEFKIAKIGILAFLIVLLSCNSSENKYEDYNEGDFYEVQGIITKTINSPKLFDSPRSRTVFYNYHLDLGEPLVGKEENIDLVLNTGDPIVVLVHKDNIKISFFGRHGIIDDRLKMEVR
ncbi:hypothetical protein VOI54_04315 [Tamlana sp. 2201CG12-4]|uniref:hypothetical protein n=1 Tax=Tamlana sp. 2201CG12-4 TaxID=3112582 RepID=UPI002DBD3D4F|nr:hypothetical protein [Tamlana sp. 2201CG12-4]MEC3906228.1 hypothetical protein [Tamlana sp. 2201CG12-4]